MSAHAATDEIPAVDQFATIQVPEPPLTALFRGLLESGGYATVHVIDGSRIKGRVVWLSEDGRSVEIENVDSYVFDVGAIVFVKIEHPAGEARRG